MSAAKSYIVLCRHGQRVPGKKLRDCDPDRWLPYSLAHSDLSLSGLFDKFPVFSHVYNGVPHDQQKHPFGSLTRHGAQFATTKGAELGERFPLIPSILASARSNPFNSSVQVHATNYRRTQITAQCLLDGLYSTTHAAQSHATPSRTTNHIPIAVHSVTSCPMTFYDSHPVTTRAIVDKVVHSEEYRAEANREAVRRAQTILSAAIPELAKGPRGFDWPSAFDLFACSAAHDLFDKDARLAELREVENTTLEHYVYRYWFYYKDNEHLSYFVSNLLGHFSRTLAHFQSRPDHSHFALYSGHDINLFAFLIAIGDSNTVRGPKDRGLSLSNLYELWPGFASTIVLEYTPQDDGNGGIRIYRDQQPLDVSLTLNSLRELFNSLQAYQSLPVEKMTRHM